MNTLTKNLLLFLLLSSTFILPACGSKEVKSEKVSETVLKSSNNAVAPPMVLMTSTVAATPGTITNASSHPYTKHTFFTKHHALSRVVPMMAAATPLVSTAPATMDITTTNDMSQKKPSSNWPLIVAGIALVAALLFYVWTKKAPPPNDFPLPPMGGLSPVSGFTAMRNKVQTETKKQSIWTKKVF